MHCLSASRDSSARLPKAAYAFFAPGLTTEKFPLRMPDCGGVTGWIPSGLGALTQAAPGRVEWDPYQLQPDGMEVVVDLGEECVVNTVILRHLSTPTEFSFHDDPHMCARGIARAELRCLSQAAGGPQGPITLAAERGASLPEEIRFETSGERASEIRIILSPRGGIGLTAIEIWGDPVLALYPTPQALVLGDQPYAPSACAAIFAAASESAPAQLLARRLREAVGLDLAVREARLPPACLVLGDAPDAPLPELLHPHREAHALHCDQLGIRIRARSTAGLFMAAGTVVRLADQIDGSVTLRPLQIEDHPDTALRGMHLFLPARRNLPFVLRYLEYLAQGLKFNTVILQLTPFLRFKSHPELEGPFRRLIAQAHADPRRFHPHTLHDRAGGGEFVDQEVVLEILAKAREVGLEVIPEIQTMSHSAWYLAAHPELAEDRQALAPIDHCPSNPATRELVQELIEEAIALVKPRAVHIGHDEVRAIGRCPLCRGHDGAELFAADVGWLHGLLSSKGLRTHMWSDHLIATHNGRFHGTHRAAAGLPKDIVLYNWTPRSHLGPMNEQVDLGFEEVLAGGYSPHFRDKPRQRELHGRSYRPGYVLTTWTEAEPVALGASLRASLTNPVYAAESLWSAGNTAFEGPLFWARVEAEVRRMRREVLLEPAPCGELLPLPLPICQPISDGLLPLADLPTIVPVPSGGRFIVDPARCLLVEHPLAREARHPPSSPVVPLGRPAAGLSFLLALRGEAVARAEEMTAARFIITSADGTEHAIPVIVNIHVGDLRRFVHGQRTEAHALPGADLVWLGDLGGKPGALYALHWRNPQPAGNLASVRLEALPDGPSFVLGWLALAEHETPARPSTGSPIPAGQRSA